MTQQDRLQKIQVGIKFFKNFPERFEDKKTKDFFYRWLPHLEEYLKNAKTPNDDFFEAAQQEGFIVE